MSASVAERDAIDRLDACSHEEIYRALAFTSGYNPDAFNAAMDRIEATRTPSRITCADLTCSCNAGPTYSKPATPGGLLAEDEERWFNHVCDAVDEYLRLYALHRETPKADQPPVEAEMHEAKRAVIDRFYAMGWDQA